MWRGPASRKSRQVPRAWCLLPPWGGHPSAQRSLCSSPLQYQGLPAAAQWLQGTRASQLAAQLLQGTSRWLTTPHQATMTRCSECRTLPGRAHPSSIAATGALHAQRTDHTYFLLQPTVLCCRAPEGESGEGRCSVPPSGALQGAQVEQQEHPHVCGFRRHHCGFRRHHCGQSPCTTHACAASVCCLGASAGAAEDGGLCGRRGMAAWWALWPHADWGAPAGALATRAAAPTRQGARRSMCRLRSTQLQYYAYLYRFMIEMSNVAESGVPAGSSTASSAHWGGGMGARGAGAQGGIAGRACCLSAATRQWVGHATPTASWTCS